MAANLINSRTKQFKSPGKTIWSTGWNPDHNICRLKIGVQLETAIRWRRAPPAKQVFIGALQLFDGLSNIFWGEYRWSQNSIRASTKFAVCKALHGPSVRLWLWSALVGVADIAHGQLRAKAYTRFEVSLVRRKCAFPAERISRCLQESRQYLCKNSGFLLALFYRWCFGVVRRFCEARALESTRRPTCKAAPHFHVPRSSRIIYPSCEVFQQRKFPLPAQWT
jgi:hypothetical protein